MDTQTLIGFFESIIGEIPAELESLVYVLLLIVVLYVVDQFFTMLSAIFGVTKWQR